MSTLHELIQSDILIAWGTLFVAFGIVAKCAGVFVDSSVAIANRFRVPKLLIGIFLVSLATTAPELSVSVISSLRGNPEIALGNAIGSVIVDDSLGLGLAGLLALAPVLVIPHVLRTAGAFLIFVESLCFIFVARDFALQRWEGAILVLLFFGYSTYLFIQHKSGRFRGDVDLEAIEKGGVASLLKLFPLFVLGVSGIIVSSSFVVTSATTIARFFSIPEAVIALTLVALGTSLPEVATCISAVRKGEGAIAVGNILGADIMNICWVAGASAAVHDLILTEKEIYFMFPAMFLVVGVMLLLLKRGYRLTRKKGVTLLLLYGLYITSFLVFFPPQ